MNDMKPEEKNAPVSKPHAEPETKPKSVKPVPDQATIDALLMVTRLDHEQRQNGGGNDAVHWWNPVEWLHAPPAALKQSVIKLVLIVGGSIALSIFTEYFIAHHGFKG